METAAEIDNDNPSRRCSVVKFRSAFKQQLILGQKFASQKSACESEMEMNSQRLLGLCLLCLTSCGQTHTEATQQTDTE